MDENPRWEKIVSERSTGVFIPSSLLGRYDFLISVTTSAIHRLFSGFVLLWVSDIWRSSIQDDSKI